MKLLLGGGTSTKEGFTNIDHLPLQGVDIVADLAKGIPVPDNSVEEVVADYVLNLLPDTQFIMEEIWRVCIAGARVTIKVPYFKSQFAVKDATNKTFFVERTFEQFDKSFIESGKLADYQAKCDLRIKKVTYNYVSRGTKYLPFKALLRRFLWDVVKNIVVELEVVK